jgi:hypothetical protein
MVEQRGRIALDLRRRIALRRPHFFEIFISMR